MVRTRQVKNTLNFANKNSPIPPFNDFVIPETTPNNAVISDACNINNSLLGNSIIKCNADSVVLATLPADSINLSNLADVTAPLSVVTESLDLAALSALSFSSLIPSGLPVTTHLVDLSTSVLTETNVALDSSSALSETIQCPSSILHEDKCIVCSTNFKINKEGQCIDTIGCYACDRWYHFECADISKKNNKVSVEWFCDTCKNKKTGTNEKNVPTTKY